MKMQVELPDVSDAEALQRAERAALEAGVLELYASRSVSGGRASELLRLPLRRFLELASSRGIPVLEIDRPLDEEADSARAADRRS